MKTTGKITEIREFLKDGDTGSIALVPTMGALHSGHMKLVEEAKKHADTVVVSIFVNPLQFGPDEDFDSYPRDLEKDLGICREAGVDYVFHPETEEMYPREPELDISLNSMADVLDGIKRPGHFEGVVTVVNKLFNIIRPDYATFGEKDRQQLMIVQRMVEDFNHDVEILPVKTERHENGLAKSSRNTNLSEQELSEAPHVYQSLKLGEALILDGEKEAAAVISRIRRHIEEHTDGKVDDLQIFTHPDLDPVTRIETDVIIFIAVQYERARLIDNLLIEISRSRQ